MAKAPEPGGGWLVLRQFRLVVAALAALLAGSVLAQSPAPAPDAVVTILHINDVHEMDSAEGGRVGGLARVATVARRLRRTSAPVVVSLGGDFLSPAAIGAARVGGEPLAGRQAVAVLNLVGVDVATFGNHEFDFSEAILRARLAESRFRVVSANVTDASGQPFAPASRSAVLPLDVAGRTVRIGFIGLTIDFNRKPWVRYAPAVDAARDEVAALTGRVDAIVVLSHLGLPGEQAVAAAVPGIDLILGGHEHENWQIRRGPRLTPIAKADANGRSVVVATLAFAAPGVRPTVDTTVEAMSESVPRDPAVQAEIDRWMSLGFEAFRRDGFAPEAVIATIAEPLDGRESTVRNRPGNLTSLITAAMLREVPQADTAILNGGSVRIDDVLPAGEVRQYDVIRMLPFGGKVVGATLEGALLAEVLDAGALNQGTGGFLHADGVERADGRWLLRGRALDPVARYRVALPEFLLTGGESRLGFLTRTNPRVRDVEDRRDVRQAVIDELRRRR